MQSHLALIFIERCFHIRLSISITYDMLVDEILSLLKQNIVLVFVGSCLGIFGYPPKRVCIR